MNIPRFRTLLAVACFLIVILAAALAFRGGSASSPGTPGTAVPRQVNAGSEHAPSQTAGAPLRVPGASFQVRADGERAYIVAASLPDGSKLETRYALASESVNLDSEPAAPEAGSPLRGFRLEHSADGTRLQWSYRYVVSRGTFPDQALSSAREIPDSVVARLLSAAVSGVEAAQDSGVEVIAKGEVVEVAKDVVGRVEEHVGGSNPVTGYVGGVLSVSEAWQTSVGYRKLLERLAALRRCAENPTNVLTRKMYSEDPASRQRILDDIASAEAELKMDTVVRFVNALNSQGADLAGQKWLGFVVGPLASWADSRIAQLGEQRVADLERSVTKCESAGPWRGTITYSVKGQGTPIVPNGSGSESYEYEQMATVVSTESESPDQVVLEALVSARGVMAGQSSSRVEVRGRCYEDTPTILAQLTTNENKHRFELNAESRETVSIQFDQAAGKYDLSFPSIGGEAKGKNERHGTYTDNCTGTSKPTDEVDDTPAFFESEEVSATGTFEASGALPSSLSGSVTTTRMYQDMERAITIRWELTRSAGTSNRTGRQ